MEERIFCQCCGMPLDAPEDMGSNADGSPNRDYCRWCYREGRIHRAGGHSGGHDRL